MHAKLYITSRCLHNCGLCPDTSKNVTSMSLKTGRQAFDFVFTNSKSDKEVNLAFMGGEPLTELSLIKELISYADLKAHQKRKNVIFTLHTNGLLITKKVLSWLQRYRVQIIWFINPVITSNNSPINQRGWNKFNFLLQYRPPVVTKLIIVPSQVKNGPLILRKLNRMGFTSFVLELDFKSQWRKLNLKDLKSAYNKIGRLYLKNFRQGRRIKINIIDGKIEKTIRPRFSQFCGAGVSDISIFPNGKIYPCIWNANAKGLDSIGHIAKGFLPLKRAPYLNYRSTEEKECRQCSFWGICFYECPMLNYQLTGDIYQVPKIICECEKISILLAQQVATKLYREKNSLFLKEFYKVNKERQKD